MSLRLMRRPRFAVRRGFTLIELLVVIAIISILASMIFPSFSRARESARRVDCSSNLRQVGIGITMYSQDYDERFPIGFPFWSVNAGVPNQPQLSKNLYTYLKSYQVWNCKSWTGVYVPDSDEGNYSFITAANPATLNNGVIGIPSDPDRLARSDSSLQQPSSYPLMFCGAAPQQVPNFLHGHTLIDDNAWANGTIGGTNVLYADTHVKWKVCTRGGWDQLYETSLNGN